MLVFTADQLLIHNDKTWHKALYLCFSVAFDDKTRKAVEIPQEKIKEIWNAVAGIIHTCGKEVGYSGSADPENVENIKSVYVITGAIPMKS